MYVVWYLNASGLLGLLLRLPQTALRQPGAHQPDPTASSRAALVYEQVCRVSLAFLFSSTVHEDVLLFDANQVLFQIAKCSEASRFDVLLTLSAVFCVGS